MVGTGSRNAVLVVTVTSHIRHFDVGARTRSTRIATSFKARCATANTHHTLGSAVQTIAGSPGPVLSSRVGPISSYLAFQRVPSIRVYTRNILLPCRPFVIVDSAVVYILRYLNSTQYSTIPVVGSSNARQCSETFRLLNLQSLLSFHFAVVRVQDPINSDVKFYKASDVSFTNRPWGLLSL
jgi:hypothetical protein